MSDLYRIAREIRKDKNGYQQFESNSTLRMVVKVEATDRICVEHYRMPTKDDSHCDIRGVSTRCKMVDVVRVPKEDTTNSDSISSRLVDPRPAAFRVALNDMVGHEPKEDEA